MDAHTPRQKERIIDQKRRKETYTHTKSEREGDMRYFFFLFLGFGFRREGSWVVWKRKVLGLEERSFVVQEK